MAAGCVEVREESPWCCNSVRGELGPHCWDVVSSRRHLLVVLHVCVVVVGGGGGGGGGDMYEYM